MANPSASTPAWQAHTLAVDRSQARKPELVRVTENVYAALGFGISNVLFVITDLSVVVIDTTESVRGARAALAQLRKFCPLPVSYIIYTHFHGDHIRGARAFHTPSTHVVAHRNLIEEIAKANRLRPYHRRRVAHQFEPSPGQAMPDNAAVVPARAGYVPPDVLFDDRHCFVEGGIAFELSHTEGETLDHLMVWLPGQKILFPGDLFYNSFPMLSSPMFPDRPVRAWAESLERMRALRPEYFVPSHSRPLAGAEIIDTTLGNYVEAIRFIHEETVRGINEGLGLEQIRARVRLPERLAKLPYLQERYGTVAWAVNGVFRQYTDWYTFNPKDLDPSPRGVFCSALLEACGGGTAIIERARQALAAGLDQLALELADIVRDAVGGDGSAQAVRVQALLRLAKSAKNNVARNIYEGALRELPDQQMPVIEQVSQSDAEARLATTSTDDTSRGNGTVAPFPAEPLGPTTADSASRDSKTPKPVILNDPCFLLAPPLGFTAILGTMLGRHPQMYGLPETHLFGYETLTEWWAHCSQASFAMAHGLLRAVAQLEYGDQTEAAVALASGWLRRRLHLTTGAVLEALAERVHPRILVEKSPSLVHNVESMRRVYAMFPQARFIHLLRHPRSHGEAVLAAIQEAAAHEPLPPSHWLLHLCSFPPASPAAGKEPETAAPEGCLDPQWGWYTLNRNIADFLEGVPTAQVFRVRAEYLLSDPDTALPALAAWLGLRDDAVAIHEMKHPERSVYARFGPVNATYGDDPSFFQNPGLRPGLAEAMSLEGPLGWRADGQGFAPAVRRFAQELGYT